jgi:hypothetical protein
MLRNVNCTLLPAAVLLAAAFNQAFADVNYVGFYNEASGLGAAARVDRTDKPVTTAAQGFSAGWTHTVSVSSAVFYYNEVSGAAAVAVPDKNGDMTTVNDVKFSAGWTSIVYHRGYLLFYKKTNGLGVMGYLQLSGGKYIFHQFPDVYHFSTNWTNIVSTSNNIIFYNAEDGSAATGAWTYTYPSNCTGFCSPSDVKFKQRMSYAKGTLTSGWTSIVDTGSGVLFYRATDGLSAMADVDTTGHIHTHKNTVMYMSAGWTAIEATAGDLLFYNKDNGNGAIGHIVQSYEAIGQLVGTVTTDQSLPGYFSTGWTSLFTFSVSIIH